MTQWLESASEMDVCVIFIIPVRVPVNDGRRAAPCASSYSLFEPEDLVMEQKLMYYKAYSDQWGLQSDHFTARMVREVKQLARSTRVCVASSHSRPTRFMLDLPQASQSVSRAQPGAAGVGSSPSTEG